MSVLPILRWPDNRLKQRCMPVENIDGALLDLARNMLDTMYAASGRGLAAPQVGAMFRLFVMDAGWKEGAADPMVIVNPDILSMSESRETGPEGCLSIPGISAAVSRTTQLRLRWTTLDGEMTERDLAGAAAVCAQHEFDHLDGIVTFDRVAPDMREKLMAEFGA